MQKKLKYQKNTIYEKKAQEIFKDNPFYYSINFKCDKLFTNEKIEEIFYKNTPYINCDIYKINYIKCIVYDCAKNIIFNIAFKETNAVKSVYTRDILKLLNDNIKFFKDDIKRLKKYISLVKKF